MFCLASRVGLSLSHHESAFQRPSFTKALEPSISTGFRVDIVHLDFPLSEGDLKLRTQLNHIFDD
jgi:hypothetical protein